jgi:hypothetical protein
VTWIDVAQVGAAVGAIARRPKLSIEEELDRANSLVETSDLGGMPHVRILVRNVKRRRAAQGTRVLIEGYTARGSDLPGFRTLGHQSLDWPSNGEAATTGAVTVFAGGARPITLGYFIRVRINPATGGFLRPRQLTCTAVRCASIRTTRAMRITRRMQRQPQVGTCVSRSRSATTSSASATSSHRSKTDTPSDFWSARMMAPRALTRSTSTGTEIPIYVLPKYSKVR